MPTGQPFITSEHVDDGPNISRIQETPRASQRRTTQSSDEVSVHRK